MPQKNETTNKGRINYVKIKQERKGFFRDLLKTWIGIFLINIKNIATRKFRIKFNFLS